MAAKKLAFDEEARHALERGVDLGREFTALEPRPRVIVGIGAVDVLQKSRR